MTCQVTGIFYSNPVCIKLLQEADEKKDNGSMEEKKEEKTFTSCSLSFQPKSSDKENFILAPLIIITSPVIGHLTPPPDTTVRI